MERKEHMDIDGSVLEGGGQILRIATALSTVLGVPIVVRNIRAGRSSPGLRPQHLTGLQLAQQLCGGKLEGGSIGSTEIKFIPGRIGSGNFVASTGTAGSVVLLLQVALPCLAFASGPCRLMLKGGTNAEMAPQIDYMTMVFQPILEKFGLKFDCRILKRGYFPKGGGEVEVNTTPLESCLKPVCLTEAAPVSSFKGRSFVAGVLPIKIAHNMADIAAKFLRRDYPGIPLKIDRLKESPEAAVGNGTGIILVAETSSGCLFGSSALGKRGVPAEDVGDNAVKEMLEDLKHEACVDRHMQDQLVVFMALAEGKSQLLCGPLTLHTKTAIHVIELMTQVKFQITPKSGSQVLVECDGIGMKTQRT